MSYVVLARKWRPQSFADLVGQGHVAATLGNAIKSGRVAHAFLFTGVRGVGKTTSARILAKALNCMASDGPTATPCLTCSACKEITDGVDVDVQEIDGASYNGVDEVRRLQESLPYRPSRDRYKIFIVDEVHMLSNSAWNAFLKTLEEPPPHVKFIFATTEVHKVPVTILSRVQRFDFKLIGPRQIAERLRWVLNQEKITADDAALAVLAREAAGSMRDAMSLLDQVIAWSDQSLTEQAVSQVLGVASRKILYDLVAELIAGQAGPILTIIDSLANQGFDITHVTRDLLAVLRDVVVVASVDSSDQLVELPEDERAHVQALARHNLDDLLRLHQGFSKGYDEVARSGQPRAALEMLLLRLARRPALVPIEDLVERLIRLEKRLQGGAARGPGTPTPGGVPPGRTGQGEGPSAGRPAPQRATTAQGSAVPAVAVPAVAVPAVAVPAVAVPAVAVPSSVIALRAEPPPAEQAATSTVAPPSTPAVTQRVVETAATDSSASPGEAGNSAVHTSTVELSRPSLKVAPPANPAEPVSVSPVPVNTAGRVEPRPVAAAPVDSPTAGSVTVAPAAVAAISAPPASVPPSSAGVSSQTQANSPVERWRQVVNAISLSDPKNGAFLAHAEVLETDQHRIRLRYERGSIASMALEDRAVQAKICQVASTLFGSLPELSLHQREPESGTVARPASPRPEPTPAIEEAGEISAPQSVFAVDREQRALAEQAALAEARNHPMVLEAVRVLGARLKHIELPKT